MSATILPLEEARHLPELMHHNNPPPDRPQAITDSIPVYKAAAAWLENNPVIDSEELSLAATQHRSNLKAALAAMTKSKEAMCKPLYAAWQAGLEVWKKPLATVEGLEKIVSDRLADYMREEEQKRQAILAEARRQEAEARRIAEEAEAREREAIENAKVGECTDVAGATRSADAAFEQFEAAAKTSRFAARDAKVRTRGAHDERATSLRTKKTLRVSDPAAAFKALWPLYGDKGLSDAFLTAARNYRQNHGNALPPGIEEDEERVL